METDVRSSQVIAIVQARMGSSRLPGKVLADIGGKPMLYRVVIRVRRAQYVGQVVVATTTDSNDDLVAEYCRSVGFPCYRGEPMDVLDRYYQVACLFDAHTIIRITGDCPLIDPVEVDRTISSFFQQKVDFAANRLPPPWKRTTPIGLDTEVVSFSALAQAWREAQAKHEREHVMPFFYEQEGRFKTLLVDSERDLSHLRLTVDSDQDLILVRNIYQHFDNSDQFSLDEVVTLLEQHPEFRLINAEVQHKSFQDTDTRF